MPALYSIHGWHPFLLYSSREFNKFLTFLKFLSQLLGNQNYRNPLSIVMETTQDARPLVFKKF